MAGGDAWVFINGKWVLRSKTRNPGQNPTPPPPPPTTTPGLPPVVTTNPQTTFSSYANYILPFLSPEDQKTISDLIARTTPGQVVGGGEGRMINPAVPPPTVIPGGIRDRPNSPSLLKTSFIRNQMLSKDRATQALAALERMKSAAGNQNLGPGYTFLKQALGILDMYGGEGGMNGMSRANYQKFSAAVDNLLSSVQDSEGLAPYVSLAGAFLRPSYSSGPLFSTQQIGNRTFFGAPSRRLFT